MTRLFSLGVLTRAVFGATLNCILFVIIGFFLTICDIDLSFSPVDDVLNSDRDFFNLIFKTSIMSLIYWLHALWITYIWSTT